MKKTIGLMGGILLSLLIQNSYAQQGWDAKNNATVDSITAKYKNKMVESKPAPKTSDIFPVLGKYESATNPEAAILTITIDEQNKGIIWIEGLPQGKVKAALRKSPATYKIPEQQTETGKQVAEGTLIFDNETGTLRMNIGKAFDVVNPEAAFVAPETAETAIGTAKAKSKKPATPKPWIYTGNKLSEETAAQ